MSRRQRALLREPLTRAIESYMSFLLARPAFVRLIIREELRDGEGLRLAQRDATAMRDALAAVRAVARKRSLRRFDVDDAVLVLVSLTFSPLSQQSTFMAALARDLRHAAVRRQHVRLVVSRCCTCSARRTRARKPTEPLIATPDSSREPGAVQG